MAQGAASVFISRVGKGEVEDFGRELAQLHAKIGQQAVELDCLSRVSRRIVRRRLHTSGYKPDLPW